VAQADAAEHAPRLVSLRGASQTADPSGDQSRPDRFPLVRENSSPINHDFERRPAGDTVWDSPIRHIPLPSIVKASTLILWRH
jgi:hypothetical protein